MAVLIVVASALVFIGVSIGIVRLCYIFTPKEPNDV